MKSLSRCSRSLTSPLRHPINQSIRTFVQTTNQPVDHSHSQPNIVYRPVKKSRGFRIILMASVVGGLIASWYWKRQNNGWPIEILTLINQANVRISQSNNQPIEQAIKSLNEAENLLKQALNLCQIPESAIKQSNQPNQRSNSQSMFTLPVVIDPLLAPHICMKIGEVCVKQAQLLNQSTASQSTSQSRDLLKSAEQYFLYSLRCLVGEAEQKHRIEQFKNKRPANQSNKQSSKQPDSHPIYDPRVVLVALQLGECYSLMGDANASESVLMRCLQIIEQMIAMNQSVNQSTNKIVKRDQASQESNSLSAVPRECDLSEDEVRLIGPDGLAEVSSQLSQLARMQNNFQQSINWAQQALLFNTQAMESSNQTSDQIISQSLSPLEHGLMIDRLYRELNLFTALSNDYYQAAHLSANRSINQSRKLMAMSYAAAIHAVDTFDRLVDRSIDASVDQSKLSNMRPAPFIKPSSNQTIKESYIPVAESDESTSHASIAQLVDRPSLTRLMQSKPSVQRDTLLIECAAVFANLGAILAAQSSDQNLIQTNGELAEDVKSVFRVAERAARMSGHADIVQTVQQQKQAALSPSSV